MPRLVAQQGSTLGTSTVTVFTCPSVRVILSASTRPKQMAGWTVPLYSFNGYGVNYLHDKTWALADRHNGGGSYIFADGHVRWMRRDAVISGPPCLYTGGGLRSKPRWCQ
jgi:prepilin-type processing-associated H-X9-DG protein